MGGFELVGTVEFRDGSVVKILRQYYPALGFQYFLEENGELKPFDAFGEREYGFRMPYPVMLDQWTVRRSVDLKVYHIEDDDWGAEIGGQTVREWCEKAFCYYEGDEEMDFWREYWGLLKDEREALYYFFEKFLREKKNVSRKERWKEWEFRRIILNVSLGEYRERLVEHFIEKMVYVLECGLEEPRNKAKGLLVWLDEHEANDWGWSMVSIMDTALNGLYEWDYLTAEEREEMASAIYERLEELAEKEEDWAGLSLEKWLDLLKKELVERKVIKDTDTAFWKWIKRYLERRDEDMYDLLWWTLEENADWYWMPCKEKKELASALEEYIIEKLEEMAERTA
ncbi:hypothetical protein [Thermocrinis sp.]|jgi:hypothetical protein|uniref:hypothetical protein n=1 Tax=Thermocrinis sp. TaxID=2024383 RepID=UPI003C0E3740